MAVGVDQHAEVVRRLSLTRLGVGEVGQPKRDHRLPQAMLHRLAQAEVGGVRQRRHKLGNPHPAHVPPHAHSVLAPTSGGRPHRQVTSCDATARTP